MEFHDNGTISLTIGGTTYTLRRPTLGQLWEFFEYRETLAQTAQARIEELVRKIAEAPEGVAVETAEVQDRRFAFTHLNEPFLRRAFEVLGSAPLPADLSDAPAGIADPKLPNEILLHWRDVPLARSRRAT